MSDSQSKAVKDAIKGKYDPPQVNNGIEQAIGGFVDALTLGIAPQPSQDEQAKNRLEYDEAWNTVNAAQPNSED